MYSNIEDAWKTSNDLDKFKNAYNPPVEIKNATNELVSSSESSEKISTPSPAIFKKEVKDLQTKIKNRKVWKALGVYYTILANKEQDFYESYKAIITKEELETLCLDVKKDTKEKAVEYLSKLLNTLKVRKQRLKNK